MREDRIEQGEGDFTPEPRTLPQTNITEWTLHPYGHLDDLGYCGGYCGHHHRTIQDERRYKLAKKKHDRRAQRAAKKARKRNRR